MSSNRNYAEGMEQEFQAKKNNKMNYQMKKVLPKKREGLDFAKQGLHQKSFVFQDDANKNYATQHLPIEYIQNNDDIQNSSFLEEKSQHKEIKGIQEKLSQDKDVNINQESGLQDYFKPSKISIKQQQLWLLQQEEQQKFKETPQQQQQYQYQIEEQQYESEEQEEVKIDLETSQYQQHDDVKIDAFDQIITKKKGGTKDFSSQGSERNSQISTKSKPISNLLQHIQRQNLPIKRPTQTPISQRTSTISKQGKITSSTSEIDVQASKQIPLDIKEISKDDRSRNRTQKQNDNRYLKHKDHNLKEVSQRRNFDSHKLPEQPKRRSMKDIAGESLRTSYALSKKSFKWSSRANNSVTSHKSKEEENFQGKQEEDKIISIEIHSSDESMEIEEGVNELSINIRQNISIPFESQKITEQKGFRFKQARKEKNLNQQNQFLSEEQNQILQKQLDYLVNLELFRSVEIFGEAMTQFFQLPRQFLNQIIKQSEKFKFHSCIGEGSFGVVDLYFMKDMKSQQQLQIQPPVASNSSQSTEYQTFANKLPLSLIKSSVQSLNFEQNAQFTQERQNENANSISTNQQMNSHKIENEINMVDTNLIVPEQQKENEYTIKQSSVNMEDNKMNLENDMDDLRGLPVAGKTIQNMEEFTRELFIMQNVNCEYMPRLVYADLDRKLLFMELGLCSLEDLKMESEDKNFSFEDEFTYSILVTMIKAIESLLTNVDRETGSSKPLFHSDIKPSNVMLTVKRYPNESTCSIKLLLIDYGGSSFSIDDYWSFYTPAFVCPILWQKLINYTSVPSFTGQCSMRQTPNIQVITNKNENQQGQQQNQQLSLKNKLQSNQYLTWQEIRYAEVYAACRSVQYLIVDLTKKQLFAKDNYEQFLQEYTYLYPKTCKILQLVFRREGSPQIHDIYAEVLSKSNSSIYTGEQPQNIPFEINKIFQISKFYTLFNSDQINQTS